MAQEQRLKKNQFSFLLYDENGLPKYFSISKILLRSILYGLPTITLLCMISIMGFLIYFKQIRAIVTRKEPQIIQSLRNENLVLTQSKQQLETLVDRLVKKTAETKIDNLELGQLMLFSPPSGFVDLTSTPVFSIEEISLSRDNTNTHLRFNIVNQTNNAEKKAGYAFIIMKAENTYQIYPKLEEGVEEMNLKYNMGENFATTKFRPVSAIFKGAYKSKLILFKILIFSKTGDLLHKHLFTSESLENNN